MVAKYDLHHDRSQCLDRSAARMVEPVSCRDLRLEMIIGQPPDTAVISFEGSRSMVWVMESFTARPTGSSSMVQRESPSALSSGLSSCHQRITSRRGGSDSRILPASVTQPSG